MDSAPPVVVTARITGDAESLPLRELEEELTREMLAAADALEFEKAAYIRDQLKALQKKG